LWGKIPNLAKLTFRQDWNLAPQEESKMALNPTTVEEKAALLLKSLSPEKAEGLLARLDASHRERLRVTMTRLEQEQKSQGVLDQVVRDFETVLRFTPRDAVELSTRGDEKKPSRRDAPAAPATAGDKPSGDAADDPLAGLRGMSVDHLAAALQQEQPRTVALVLGRLEADRAGEVLKRLPSELRREVSPRLGQTVEVNPLLLPRIAQAIARKAQLLSERPAKPSDDAKYKRMADMLRQLDKEARAEMLTALEGHDAQTAARVREFLYQFEDLLNIEDRSIQKLLTEIDSKTLATAIKGAPEDLALRIFDNLSKRARETLTEEMEFLGSTPAAQVQQAQKVIIDAIQRLDQAGELVMKQ
jgi:flagellar motor switch protein FliG